jgi:CRP-like cAMP-binding protein
MSYNNSLFLDSLPHDEGVALRGRLERIHLAQQQVLFEQDGPVSHVYFPVDAVVSQVVMLLDGEAVEAAMTGHDGITAAGPALVAEPSYNRGIVQLSGDAFRCTAGDFRKICAQRPYLNRAVVLHELALLAQVQQSAACNCTHTLEGRLARWLLRASDLHGGGVLDFTQEFLAQMLGVRRTSVTSIAHILQRAGLIRYSRGHIEITNREALEETACECYEAVKKRNNDFLKNLQSGAQA